LKRTKAEQYEYEIASGDFSAYSSDDLEKALDYLETEPRAGDELKLCDLDVPKKADFEERNRAHDERMQSNPWFKLHSR
jgi:hypothetical protein